MEVDVVSPSAREVVKHQPAVGGGTVLPAAPRPMPVSLSDGFQAGPRFSDEISPTQSHDLEMLRLEIMREQQKLFSVVEQQGAVLQDMHARMQHQQLSPVKPSQPKRQPSHIRSSELDGPAARHLKYAATLSFVA
jgi:hypothetical protein